MPYVYNDHLSQHYFPAGFVDVNVTIGEDLNTLIHIRITHMKEQYPSVLTMAACSVRRTEVAFGTMVKMDQVIMILESGHNYLQLLGRV